MNFKDDEELTKEINDLSLYLERIGLHRLAVEVRHEQFLARLLDANLLANRWEFETDYLNRREDDIQNILTDFQTQAFDKSQSYNNIIVTLGYAGFFAIWNFTNDNLVEFDRALIALLLGFSLLVFITWTLRQSTLLVSTNKARAEILTREYDDRDELLASRKQPPTNVLWHSYVGIH